MDHYDVVWRDTTAATWTDEQDVAPDVREARTRSGATRKVVQGRVVGVTADTNFFGVRAVSASGHRSRVILPSRP